MTEVDTVAISYGDALTQPFWEAARHHRLIIQRCTKCGNYQFYPRPFCLQCQSNDLGWVDAMGTGEVYSVTTVRMDVLPELPPPYQVAIIQLDEGPRMLAGLAGNQSNIGDRVTLTWREREDLPPLPMFSVEGIHP
ncbi:MAG: Zn-ribbon domain-containing OB-fold protein [Chloroflexota bacterium]